jgi:hypothetical protein
MAGVHPFVTAVIFTLPVLKVYITLPLGLSVSVKTLEDLLYKYTINVLVFDRKAAEPFAPAVNSDGKKSE